MTLDNLEITMTADNLMARNGIFVVGESGIISGITIKDCYIRNIHGTHLGQVEAGDYWDSFYASGAISFRYLKDKTDEQNKFDRITVTGCRIENILGCGIRFHDMGAGIIDEWANAYFSNVLIEDTLIDTTSADGILFQNCYKPVVRRCKVFRVARWNRKGRRTTMRRSGRARRKVRCTNTTRSPIRNMWAATGRRSTWIGAARGSACGSTITRTTTRAA